MGFNLDKVTTVAKMGDRDGPTFNVGGKHIIRIEKMQEKGVHSGDLIQVDYTLVSGPEGASPEGSWAIFLGDKNGYDARELLDITCAVAGKEGDKEREAFQKDLSEDGARATLKEGLEANGFKGFTIGVQVVDTGKKNKYEKPIMNRRFFVAKEEAASEKA